MLIQKKALRWALIAFISSFAVAGLFYLKSKIDQKVDQTLVTSSTVNLQNDGSKSFSKGGVSFREVNWKELVQLDYKSGKKSGNLNEIENKMVRIPGYIVPLTDGTTTLDEFLFVPNEQACIHVPPPPPNLIIKARLKNKLAFEDVYNPSWLYGKLEITETKSQFGAASYQINDAELEKYEEDSAAK